MKNKKNYGLVSIIMPSYNTAKYIELTIKSVLTQTYPYFELIIIDDCSADETDKIVKNFLNDSRVKYIKNKKNSGAAFSRNRGLKEAKGKWIAFLDSDDLWLPSKLEKQIKFMYKNDYSFSYTKYGEIDENGIKNGKIVTGPNKINKFGMYCYCWPGCLTVIYDATIVGLIQIYDIKKNNDYAMWLKVSQKCNCYLLNETLALYRKRTGSISNSSPLKLVKWHYILFKYAEGYNTFISTILTINNMFWGVFKKIFYVKKKKIK